MSPFPRNVLVNVIALLAIEVLASKSLLGGALNVPVGEVYPEPPDPPGTAMIATLPPCSRETKKVVIPDEGDMLVVTPGAAVYKVPGLVTVSYTHLTLPTNREV